MGRDPIDELGGLNLFAACNNRTISRVDVLGLFNETLCKELIKKIEELVEKLNNELAKYDPIADGKGGFLHRFGITVPGGHYAEIKNLQSGIKNRLAKWKDVCSGGDDQTKCRYPYPRFADALANHPVSSPVYAYTMTNSEFWGRVVAGVAIAAGAAFALGNAGPQAVLPEEIITVPVRGLVNGVRAFVLHYWR